MVQWIKMLCVTLASHTTTDSDPDWSLSCSDSSQIPCSCIWENNRRKAHVLGTLLTTWGPNGVPDYWRSPGSALPLGAFEGETEDERAFFFSVFPSVCTQLSNK